MKFTQLYKELQRFGIPITPHNFKVLIENLKLRNKIIQLSK